MRLSNVRHTQRLVRCGAVYETCPRAVGHARGLRVSRVVHVGKAALLAGGCHNGGSSVRTSVRPGPGVRAPRPRRLLQERHAEWPRLCRFAPAAASTVHCSLSLCVVVCVCVCVRVRCCVPATVPVPICVLLALNCFTLLYTAPRSHPVPPWHRQLCAQHRLQVRQEGWRDRSLLLRTAPPRQGTAPATAAAVLW